jgi:DNA-binding response OmpR family regulator
MRLCYPQIGLLVLTNGIRIEARIRGLRLGADHFMTKPISAPKLAANIEALCRRLYSYQQSVQPTAQTWRLRTCERQLQANGEKTIQLTEKEFNFLHLLAISEQPVAREKLTQDMQLPTSGNDHDNAKRIDMLVYRLRKKVKEGLAKDLPLHSAYGAGYSLSVSLSLI